MLTGDRGDACKVERGGVRHHQILNRRIFLGFGLNFGEAECQGD